MKRSSVSLFGMFFLALLFIATTAKAENPLIGSWAFNVNQAPWEYSRGKVVFDLGKEDELSGKIIFASGIEVAINKITQEKDKVVFDIFVEGTPVKTIVTLKDDNITGFVETYEGNMPFSAKREVPEE